MLELQDYSITDLIFLWHKFPNALLTFSLFGGRQQIFYRIISCPPPPPLLPPLSILSSGEAACREKWKLARTKSPARPPLKQIVGHHPDSVGIPWQIQPKIFANWQIQRKNIFARSSRSQHWHGAAISSKTCWAPFSPNTRLQVSFTYLLPNCNWFLESLMCQKIIIFEILNVILRHVTPRICPFCFEKCVEKNYCDFWCFVGVPHSPLKQIVDLLVGHLRSEEIGVGCQVPSGKPSVMADQTAANKELIAPSWDPPVCEFHFFLKLSHPTTPSEMI